MKTNIYLEWKDLRSYINLNIFHKNNVSETSIKEWLKYDAALDKCIKAIDSAASAGDEKKITAGFQTLLAMVNKAAAAFPQSAAKDAKELWIFGKQLPPALDKLRALADSSAFEKAAAADRKIIDAVLAQFEKVKTIFDRTQLYPDKANKIANDFFKNIQKAKPADIEKFKKTSLSLIDRICTELDKDSVTITKWKTSVIETASRLELPASREKIGGFVDKARDYPTALITTRNEFDLIRDGVASYTGTAPSGTISAEQKKVYLLLDSYVQSFAQAGAAFRALFESLENKYNEIRKKTKIITSAKQYEETLENIRVNKVQTRIKEALKQLSAVEKALKDNPLRKKSDEYRALLAGYPRGEGAIILIDNYEKKAAEEHSAWRKDLQTWQTYFEKTVKEFTKKC